MKKRLTILLIVITAFVVFNDAAYAQPPQRKASVCDLRANMRKLWEDHITWTRNVIFNIIDSLPGTTEAVTRLLQNQVDIGNAFNPFYGQVAGDSLTALLYTHITTAADLLTALVNGDAAGVATANAAWYANADTIAQFLASLNSAWPLSDLEMMMEMHLDLTKAEALARYNHDYALDVQMYDSVHTEILGMSDVFANGIVQQFPHQFRPNSARYAHAVVLNDAITLGQNIPNPFDEETVISYFIPDNVLQAEISFYNFKGKLIKKVPLAGRGEGDLTVHASGLSNGTYTYSIIADGIVIDTKKMVH
jgi:hypothetical protein